MAVLFLSGGVTPPRAVESRLRVALKIAPSNGFFGHDHFAKNAPLGRFLFANIGSGSARACAKRNPVRIPAAAVGELAHQGQGAGYCRLRQIPGTPSAGVFLRWRRRPTCRRRIPFACRSPAHSFKRVLWATPLHKNAPPGRFCSLTSDRAPPALCAERNPVRIRRRSRRGACSPGARRGILPLAANSGSVVTKRNHGNPRNTSSVAPRQLTLSPSNPVCASLAGSLLQTGSLGDTAFPKLSTGEFWGR